MALTNSRPIGFPDMMEHAHEVGSPMFQVSSLELKQQKKYKKRDSSDDERSPSVGLSDDEKKKKEKKKEKKKASRAPVATGISTTIPVTGERPRPTTEAPLDDDVLYTIFMILYELDPEMKGMTVKQICDVLSERHPEMAKLSTKTSNLVSAKLNAYVKKVEKGEKTLKFALSREWADASPKRMVYVYRGILSSDYYVHAIAAMENHRQQQQSVNGQADPQDIMSSAGPSTGNTRETTPNDSSHKFGGSFLSQSFDFGGEQFKRRSTMYDLGISRNSEFSETPVDLRLPHLNVPYSVSPVAASLSNSSLDVKQQPVQQPEMDLDSGFDALEDDDFDLGDMKMFYRKDNKRSKSMSAINVKKFRTNSGSYITAAAAAPRITKTTPAPGMILQNMCPTESVLGSPDTSQGEFAKSESPEPAVSSTWLQTIRDGFLTQEIEAPESLSLAELDTMFD